MYSTENEYNSPLDNTEIIDADFNETNDIKYINGKPVYYTTSQVASMLGESDSTIRFWCGEFQEFLNIETSGRNRKFKEKDIEELKYFQKLLREENLSIKQAQEHCTTLKNELVKKESDSSNGFMMQAIANALSSEMKESLKIVKEELALEITEQLSSKLAVVMTNIIEKHSEIQVKAFNDFKKEMSASITEDLKNHIDKKEEDAKLRDIEIIDTLRKGQEESQRKANENNNKKGILSRLFNK